MTVIESRNLLSQSFSLEGLPDELADCLFGLARTMSLPAGKTVRLSLRGFYDELGEPFRAGGFFRTEKPMPVRLVEMQFSEEQPMIGLITIRAEKAE
jgi:hypothetical protein